MAKDKRIIEINSCKQCSHHNFHGFCQVTRYQIYGRYEDKGFPTWCPLKDTPTPAGKRGEKQEL